MSNDKDFLQVFENYLHEYLKTRSLKGVMQNIGQNFSAIGSALHEICLNRQTFENLFCKDLGQLTMPLQLHEKKIEIQRINNNSAIILCFGHLGATNAELNFQLRNFRISAFLSQEKGRIKIKHLHCSVPQNHEGEPKSYAILQLKSALFETREKYRLIFENAPAGIIQFDQDGLVKECNKKFQQIMSSDSSQIVGMKLLELKDRPAVDAVKATLNGRNGYYEGYYRSVNSGKLVPLQAFLSPIIGQNAEILGGIGIYEDISETRLAESKLLYQFQFEKIVATISSGFVNAPKGSIDLLIKNALKLTCNFFNADRGYIFQINPDGKTARNTHEWEEEGVDSIMHKYENMVLADLEGMGGFLDQLCDFIHIPDIKQYPPQFNSVKHILTVGEVKSLLVLPLIINNQLIGCFGYDCLNKSRTWTYEEIMLLKVIGEVFSSAFARQRAEEKLIESEEKYRLLAENASDVIWVFDLNDRCFTYVSPSVAKLLGITAQEVLDNSLKGIITPESREFFRNVTKERKDLINNQENIEFNDETTLIHKDGHLIPTEVTTTWLKDPNSGNKIVVGIARDITLRKQAEEQRSLLDKQKLQNQKADSLGRMAGSIAHHFNNQLQVITGNLELLSAGFAPNSPEQKRLADALKATNKAAELSSLMLSYLGQTHSKLETIDIVAFCQQKQPIFKENCTRNIKLSFNFEEDAIFVNADAANLQLILKNLVINSAEAIGDESGAIEIKVKKTGFADIVNENLVPLSWTPTEDHYGCIVIKDNGCGIQSQDNERIFDPFFTSKFPGRGLGLAVSLGFMRSMGGAISYITEPGCGTTFFLYFSLADWQKVEKIRPENSSSTNGSSEGAVLLVEDESMVRLITTSLLEHYNFKVIEAESGEDAVKIFKQRKDEIRLVLCDLLMPGIDGWETIKRIRKINADIPVILASGYDQSFAMKGSKRIKPNAFLNKPYGVKSLQQAIKEALST